MNTDDLVGQLPSAGVDEASIVRFDQKATPRHLRYLDLLRVWPMGPDAVVESDGQPQVYVVRQDRLGDAKGVNRQALSELIQVLGCRSDARFLVVVQPGNLNVYPVGVFTSVPQPLVTDREEPASLWRAPRHPACELPAPPGSVCGREARATSPAAGLPRTKEKVRR